MGFWLRFSWKNPLSLNPFWHAVKYQRIYPPLNYLSIKDSTLNKEVWRHSCFKSHYLILLLADLNPFYSFVINKGSFFIRVLIFLYYIRIFNGCDKSVFLAFVWFISPVYGSISKSTLSICLFWSRKLFLHKHNRKCWHLIDNIWEISIGEHQAHFFCVSNPIFWPRATLSQS